MFASITTRVAAQEATGALDRIKRVELFTINEFVISLFSGSGGLSLGFAEAGLSPSFGVELNADACTSYTANLDVECLRRDISKSATVEEIVSRSRGKKPFAIIGGPPCQGFSTAGLRNSDDPRNHLIFSYLEAVAQLKPKWVLFENVEGILTSGGGANMRDFAVQLIDLGYWVNIEKVNFASFGLPQSRKRVIVVANRLGIHYRFPDPLHSYTGKKHRSHHPLPLGSSLADALSGLGRVTLQVDAPSPYLGDPVTEYDMLMREGNARGTVTQHFAQKLSEGDFERARLLKPGESLRNLPSSMWPSSYRSRAFRRVLDGMPTSKRGGAPAGLRRLDPAHASLTITSLSARELIHPEQDRPLSLRECARIQSFPDNFEFSGNASSIAQQIGNAFPPMAASVFAQSIMQQHSAHNGMRRARSKPRLMGFKLTDSAGMSPALRSAEGLLAELMHDIPRQTFLLEYSEENPLAKLSVEQRRLVTKARNAKPITMQDRELARVVSVVLHDLRKDDYIPTFVEIPAEYTDYYHLKLDWFTQDEQRDFDLASFYLKCLAISDFETIFKCITQIHKRRRKYDLILRGQPSPTLDQVGQRGLLEYGIVPSPALTSWLLWRKWIFDIDNRSGQETGYLFEPILAHSIGGEPCGNKNSPIKRIDRKGHRQVDCLINADGIKRAYEFKIRFTTASSGQGRFREELSFPREAKASGYQPVLLVLDPTSNEKLATIVKAFEHEGGEAFVGSDAWDHISELAGPTMAAFLQKYIKEPLLKIIADDKSYPAGDLHLKWDDKKKIVVSVGPQTWEIDRTEEAEISEELVEDDQEDE